MITYDTLLCFSMIFSSTVVVFASNKGPINYLKVLVNNKKTEKPVQIFPIGRVVSAKPAIMTSDHGTPTRMTFRDVYLHGATGTPRSSTTDYDSGNHVTGNYDKRIVSCDKTVTRLSEEDELVQRICSDIISAVHRKISEKTTVAVASGLTASGTIASGPHASGGSTAPGHTASGTTTSGPTASGTTTSGTIASDTTAHRKSDQKKHKKRRRNPFRKVSLRPISHDESKKSIRLTIEPDDHNSIFAHENSRVDYLTSVGSVDEEDDNRRDEDVDQSPKESNVVDEHVIFKSVKRKVQRPKVSSTTAAKNDDDDDDDDDQTS